MPLPPPVPPELFTLLRENLAKLDKKEKEEKRRREALEEQHWRERYKKYKSACGDKSPLFATWAPSSASDAAEGVRKLKSIEPDAVGCSSQAKSSPEVEMDSSCAGQPSEEDTSSRKRATKAAKQKIVVTEAELSRRRKVEEELKALSKQITEDKSRRERIRPLVWNKPNFDPFRSSATAQSSDAIFTSSRSNPPLYPRKRRDRDQDPNPQEVGAASQKSHKTDRDSLDSIREFLGFAQYRQTPEGIDELASFIDECIPALKRSKMESMETCSGDNTNCKKKS